jgi:hypothetical protein
VVLPFVIMGNAAGLEIVHPMAIVMLGGLVTSTLVSLFMLPALYPRFGAGAQPEPVAERPLPPSVAAETERSRTGESAPERQAAPDRQERQAGAGSIPPTGGEGGEGASPGRRDG